MAFLLGGGKNRAEEKERIKLVNDTDEQLRLVDAELSLNEQKLEEYRLKIERLNKDWSDKRMLVNHSNRNQLSYEVSQHKTLYAYNRKLQTQKNRLLKCKQAHEASERNKKLWEIQKATLSTLENSLKHMENTSELDAQLEETLELLDMNSANMDNLELYDLIGFNNGSGRNQQLQQQDRALEEDIHGILNYPSSVTMTEDLIPQEFMKLPPDAQ
jgi:hypothetical protein